LTYLSLPSCFPMNPTTYHLKNSGLKAHALTGCHDEGTLA
jgi:hypothetical protein